jgi:hypothetical protein
MVNVTDVMNIVSHVLEKETEVFIKSSADVNGDGHVNITDAMGVIELILNE